MPETRFLIGQGERLSEEIARPGRGSGEKAHPYTFEEARTRLSLQGRAAARSIAELPTLACPGGQAVLELTLHPSYLAKSYYPNNLLRELALEHLGSRAAHIRPERIVAKAGQSGEKAMPAPVLYVAGDRARLEAFANGLATWRPTSEHVRDDFRQVEVLRTPGDDRLKNAGVFEKHKEAPLEVVLHVPEIDTNGMVVAAFDAYARSLGLKPLLDRRRQVGGLCFVPMHAPPEAMGELLQFTFLRALRKAARVDPFDPALRTGGMSFEVALRAEQALVPDLAVAIFDGGLPERHGLDRWVDQLEAPGVGKPVAAAQEHGLRVTSAFLFGPLAEATPHPTPFSRVDHWRIYDEEAVTDDFEQFTMLNRIESVLTSRQYDFVNISLGPDCAIGDDDVDLWTSTLDKLLAGGTTVATVACGNNGESDRVAKLHRIQPPSDGVNMLAIGAADRIGPGWRRAPYSACGPGRSPGFTKPDGLSFGGSPSSPFLCLSAVRPARASGAQGTSFAAPLGLRSTVGVRAQFAEQLWAPTVKALFVHHADPGSHDRAEVGWGLVSHDLADLVLCGDGEAHIVYQRQMPETGSVRMFLPVPPGLTGNVEIKATFSFFCEVDPEDALNYTRAGLEIQFRPNTRIRGKPYIKDGKTIIPTVPPSETFFSASDLYTSEHERRADAHKWETTFSRSKTKRVTSLDAPAFDVSLQTREHGHGGRRASNMRVALVLTLRSRRTPDLYDRVVANAGGRLQPLRARAGVPIPVRSGR